MFLQRCGSQREEVFGPIAPIIVAEDENEAIKIANDSKYGLGASIWTQDLTKQKGCQELLNLE